jgi:two-component system sensor histidine kinase KdpD
MAGLGAGIAGVAAVTFIFSRLVVANASTAGFFYLLVVLAAATTSGFRVSALISLVAMLCFNWFFLPPVGRFTIADPENWVALFTFLLTSLVASHLSDRAQRQAAEAKRRQHETERLYALSRAILLTGASRSIGVEAAQSIAQIFQSSTVLILDAKTNSIFRGGGADMESIEPRLQDVIRQGSHVREESLDIDIWPITLGGNPVGALAASGLSISDGAVQSMLNLVAIALERVRTQEAANRAEVARQSEEFKSTLLDAIAHEFKTPLTSIKAAATGLASCNDGMPADQRDLVAIIEEETERLNVLVTEAVRMAEIDAGKVKPQPVEVDPRELLIAARSSFQGRGDDRIQITKNADVIPLVMVDRDLITLAIRQVLDNALKYSDAATPVRCDVAVEPARVLIRIRDRGPGIPAADRENVFEKFYRRAGSRDKVPGSGLGLHIAREIARIDGGDLWLEESSGDGAEFCFSLPAASRVKT